MLEAFSRLPLELFGCELEVWFAYGIDAPVKLGVEVPGGESPDCASPALDELVATYPASGEAYAVERVGLDQLTYDDGYFPADPSAVAVRELRIVDDELTGPDGVTIADGYYRYVVGGDGLVMSTDLYGTQYGEANLVGGADPVVATAGRITISNGRLAGFNNEAFNYQVPNSSVGALLGSLTEVPPELFACRGVTVEFARFGVDPVVELTLGE